MMRNRGSELRRVEQETGTHHRCKPSMLNRKFFMGMLRAHVLLPFLFLECQLPSQVYVHGPRCQGRGGNAFCCCDDVSSLT